MVVSALTIYPVKSCRGISLRNCALDTLGFVGDRRFMFVSEDGKFLTQRAEPRLALIETQLSADQLFLSSVGFGSIPVPLTASGAPSRSVEVWADRGLQAEDCGATAHEWISHFLGRRFWLVRIGPAFWRPVKGTPLAPQDLVTFADGFPVLAISQASLEDLNHRLQLRGESTVPMNRFRPNLVIDGGEPYGEDSWTQVKIGSVGFRAGGPCGRCIVTTTDQFTGERAKEPLRTLGAYRRDPANPSSINFGQNLINEDKFGSVAVGDEVVLK